MKNQGLETLSRAARQVLEILGAKKVGEMVRRSAAMIYKWGDPNLHYYPNLYQALVLDNEVMKSGSGAPPFLMAYVSLLRQRYANTEFLAEEPLSDAARIVTLAARILVELSSHARAEPASSVPSQHGVEGVCQKLRELDRLIIALRWRLESDPSRLIEPVTPAPPGRRTRHKAYLRRSIK